MIHAAFKVSSRVCSIMMRALAIRSCVTAFTEGHTARRAPHIRSSALSASPISRMQ